MEALLGLTVPRGLAAQGLTQDSPPVVRAVAQAAEYLKATPDPRFPELVLWALVNAEVSREDPVFRRLMEAMDDGPIHDTYRTALRAMVYAKLDPERYGPQLRACAQFFADTQLANGQWTYGREHVAQVDRERVVRVEMVQARPGRRCRREPVELKPQLDEEVRPRQRPVQGGGDNSNTQFAALGIWACAQSGLRFPADFLVRARRWWESGQVRSGGWDYGRGGSAYGSMTAGGLSALYIYKTLLQENVEADDRVQRGLKWLATNFRADSNPGSGGWHFYYLYGVERVGILYGRDRFGGHAWYDEGARLLVGRQKGDGSWAGDGWEDGPVATALAVLFLKRAVIERRIVVQPKREARKEETAPTRNDFVFARLILAGDDDPAVPDHRRLAAALAERLGAAVRPDPVAASVREEDLKRYPFLYVSSHGEVATTEAEAELLAGWIKRGGYLYAQNCCGSKAFDAAARRLARRLTGADLDPLPKDHAIYSTVYPLRDGPTLEAALINGRPGLVYCAEDLCCGWGAEACDDACTRLAPEVCVRTAVNIVAYAFE